MQIPKHQLQSKQDKQNRANSCSTHMNTFLDMTQDLSYIHFGNKFYDFYFALSTKVHSK